MNLYGGNQWSFDQLAVPRKTVKSSTDLENPITLETFMEEVCRRPDGMKTVTMLFDIHCCVPEIGGLGSLVDAVLDGKYMSLPFPLSPAKDLPKDTNISYVIHNNEDGTMSVLKILHFASKVGIKDAVGLCTGRAYALAQRQGPWALKKGLQSLVERLPGLRILWTAMSDKSTSSAASGSSLKKSGSEQWTPEVESLREGIDFINSQAPDGDAQNEQTFWILCNIRHDSGSPISGWPEAKVRFMAQNKSKGLAGAQPQTKFPLTLFSLKPFIYDRLARIILPLLMTHGLMLLGMPGVGKTPFVIALALAIGRYHVREQALSEPAGWRRAKSLDNFRHRNPRVQEAIFLDDPQRGRVDASDLKSFLTVDEDQTCTARYCDVKLTQNGMRAYASNDFDPDDEPKNDTRQEISPEEFQTMAKKIFSGDGISDIMAMLKRSIVLIFGKNALYLRLPSENLEAIVHRITVEKVHEDLLSEKDKELYGKYKRGKVEYGHHYQSEIERELELMQYAFGFTVQAMTS